MDEKEFTDNLVGLLKPLLVGCVVDTKISLLYAISIDENGSIQLGVNESGEPIRGGGLGFEQDILVYEKVQGQTSIVPRVVAEVKFQGVTTHDAIVYSEKARRIRNIYPYLRYGLILADQPDIPPRVLRLGVEFDFIICIANPPNKVTMNNLASLFQDELNTSRTLGSILRGNLKILGFFHNITILGTQKTPAIQPAPEIKIDLPITSSVTPNKTQRSNIAYYVYENWRAEKKAVIHYGHCGSCNYGKGIHPKAGTRNGRWYGPCETYDEAYLVAKQTKKVVRNCKICAPV